MSIVFFVFSECSLGKYGENCSKNCSGHCKGNNRSHCHHIDGSCTEGCEDGWIGLTCEEGTEYVLPLEESVYV